LTICREFGDLVVSGGIGVLPYFAAFCRMKRPTAGSVGLFVGLPLPASRWPPGTRVRAVRRRGGVGRDLPGRPRQPDDLNFAWLAFGRQVDEEAA
jgi:hypothetical protein